MSKSCVYCNCLENLNTSFIITLDDGTKVSVDICDEHSEDATVKTAKAAYVARQSQIAAILQQAAALGLQLAPAGQSGLVTLTAQNKSKQDQSEQNQPEQNVIQERNTPKPNIEVQSPIDDELIPTTIIDSKDSFSPIISSNNTGVGAYSPLDLKSVAGKLPEDALQGQARPVIAEGRDGVPIRFIQYRRDKLGTTNVHIANVESDATLQARFKKMAKNSEQDKMPDFIHGGYSDTIVTCPVCRGNCFIKRSGADLACPNCNGAGVLSST